MAKRKRDKDDKESSQSHAQRKKSAQSVVSSAPKASEQNTLQSIQIITGSYDRVLHGIVATLPDSGFGESKQKEVVFHDNFLFNAHGSAIRCLALSPMSDSKNARESQKIILASGGTDERINLFSVSTLLPRTLPSKRPLSESTNSKPLLENPKNKEIGSLLHHSSNINVLHFPTRSKLLSGAEDNTVAISRTRDWTVLSTIKAPIPIPKGRPSGDTAPLGGTPAGINDFAVHPSMKLMITVGKGEKCMRLWNLVTGKKAGVLSFERAMLQAAGEGKYSSGEGRKVAWNVAGDEFVVGFERGAMVFAMDSKPKGHVTPTPKSKIHQIRYLSLPATSSELLVVSTEDGRLLFFSTERSASTQGETTKDETSDEFPEMRLVAELGGKTADIESRIKDFEILAMTEGFFIVTAGSDGALRVWRLLEKDLESKRKVSSATSSKAVGELLGTYSTNSRITCLKAFPLKAPSEGEDGQTGSKDDEASESEFEGLD